MIAISKQRLNSLAKSGWADSHGVQLHRLYLSLPRTKDEWDRAKLAVVRPERPKLRNEFNCLFSDLCWFCNRPRELNVHHISGGTKGRSDEYANFALACDLAYDDSCHRALERSKTLLPLVVFVKLVNDPEHTDFVRLCHLVGRNFLPTDFDEFSGLSTGELLKVLRGK